MKTSLGIAIGLVIALLLIQARQPAEAQQAQPQPRVREYAIFQVSEFDLTNETVYTWSSPTGETVSANSVDELAKKLGPNYNAKKGFYAAMLNFAGHDGWIFVERETDAVLRSSKLERFVFAR